MKKSLTFCILYGIATLAFAQGCPSVNELIVKKGNKYQVVVPAGWGLVSDNTNPWRQNPVFRVAAWGDHKHPSDRVRCYYYQDNPYENNLHIQLETIAFIDESRITSHPGWSNDNDPYHLCVSRSDNVNECQFG